MKPDVLIIGDSHAKALQNGCEALGLNVMHAGFSGRNWHEGNITHDPETGLWMRRAWAQKKFAEMREQLGTDTLARPGVPVLFSVGFHLGRLVPPFGWNGHVALPDGPARSKDRLSVSRGFVEDYVDAYRAKHFKLIREFAQSADLTVIAPPHSFERENYAAFREVVSERIRACGADLFDSKDNFAGQSGVLPESLLEPDGIHGNTDYGIRVIEALLDRGLLKVKRLQRRKALSAGE